MVGLAATAVTPMRYLTRISRKGKWYVPIDGTHYEIQPNQLLDGPNPTGHAVVWYDGAGDHVTIFCFAPGSLY